LEAYQPGLSDRPHGIVANKMDLETSDENLKDFVRQVSNKISSHVPIFPVSGKLGRNISPLLYFMRSVYDRQYNKEEK
jgi:GTPase involved in cell partitioning and DNA repair